MTKTFNTCQVEIGAAMRLMTNALRRMQTVCDTMKKAVDTLPPGAPEEGDYLAAHVLVDKLTDALAMTPHAYWDVMMGDEDLVIAQALGADAGVGSALRAEFPKHSAHRADAIPNGRVGPSVTGPLTVRVYAIG